MSEVLYIGDLEKAAVLAALYNNANSYGYSMIQDSQHSHEGEMTVDGAKFFIKRHKPGVGLPKLHFDYVKGRRIKVDLTNDSFNPGSFDEVLFEGAASRIVDNLRTTGEVADLGFYKENASREE